MCDFTAQMNLELCTRLARAKLLAENGSSPRGRIVSGGASEGRGRPSTGGPSPY